MLAALGWSSGRLRVVKNCTCITGKQEVMRTNRFKLRVAAPTGQNGRELLDSKLVSFSQTSAEKGSKEIQISPIKG